MSSRRWPAKDAALQVEMQFDRATVAVVLKRLHLHRAQVDFQVNPGGRAVRAGRESHRVDRLELSEWKRCILGEARLQLPQLAAEKDRGAFRLVKAGGRPLQIEGEPICADAARSRGVGQLEADGAPANEQKGSFQRHSLPYAGAPRLHRQRYNRSWKRWTRQDRCGIQRSRLCRWGLAGCPQ